MGQRVKLSIALILAGVAVWNVAQAGTLFGSRGEFSVMFKDLKYDPSKACTKPFRPYGASDADIDAYRFSLNRYRSCLLGAAKNDVEYANDVIKEGYVKALQDSAR